MILTIYHWMVMILPFITLMTTFFIAEEYGSRKANQQKYVWNPSKLHLEVLMIMVMGVVIAILLGYLSYAIIFKGFLA